MDRGGIGRARAPLRAAQTGTDANLFESALAKHSPEPVVLWVARSDRAFSSGRSLSNGPACTSDTNSAETGLNRC
ncbi:hypothetical protein SBV1_2110017 [Verrucomicrobia bacterium]|nr:hypothetical protein SBV1_2110017 [Verrucomicrobiota bacterium]